MRVAPAYSLYGHVATTLAVALGRPALDGTAGVVVDDAQGAVIELCLARSISYAAIDAAVRR